jgi:hypothetical protein
LIVVCPCAASALATIACPCLCRQWLSMPLSLSPWPQTAAPCPLLLLPQPLRCPHSRYHRRRRPHHRLCVAVAAVFVSPPAVAGADAIADIVAITAVAVSFTAALS